MASNDFIDPYLDPETGLLRNLVGALTQSALDGAEGALSFARLVQLMDRPVRPTGDLAELRAIHWHLFQDVYPFAGALRTVDIRKNTEGAQFFLPVSMLERAAVFAVGELYADSELRGMKRGQFVERLAYHYDALNYIHPFREGNGRTQRVFWNRVASTAGSQLDWRAVRGATNDHACRAASEQQDLGPLREMFDQIVSKAVSQHDRDARWRDAERARLAFPVNEGEPAREPRRPVDEEPVSLEQQLEEKVHELRARRAAQPSSSHELRDDRGRGEGR